MYKIRFYRDRRGNRPIVEHLRKLAKSKNKDSRIKANKINDYIQQLSKDGISIGEPYIKHLEDEIWELRPLRDRILFAAWDGNSFILLHHFIKDSKKTPPREIMHANVI